MKTKNLSLSNIIGLRIKGLHKFNLNSNLKTTEEGKEK